MNKCTLEDVMHVDLSIAWVFVRQGRLTDRKVKWFTGRDEGSGKEGQLSKRLRKTCFLIHG